MSSVAVCLLCRQLRLGIMQSLIGSYELYHLAHGLTARSAQSQAMDHQASSQTSLSGARTGMWSLQTCAARMKPTRQLSSEPSTKRSKNTPTSLERWPPKFLEFALLQYAPSSWAHSGAGIRPTRSVSLSWVSPGTAAKCCVSSVWLMRSRDQRQSGPAWRVEFSRGASWIRPPRQPWRALPLGLSASQPHRGRAARMILVLQRLFCHLSK